MLLTDIESGQLKPGDKVSPEEEYAARLGVSVAPVRQAILSLVSEGLLTRTRGRGTFVTPPPVIETVTTLSGFSASMRRKGRTIEMHVLANGLVPTPKWVKESLELPRRKVFELRRLALENGGPIALLTSYLDSDRFPKILAVDFSQHSLYDFLREDCGMRMVHAQNIVEVVRASADDAELLGIPARAPVLRASHVTFAQDERAVEAALVLYPADRVRLAFDSYASPGDEEKEETTARET